MLRKENCAGGKKTFSFPLTVSLLFLLFFVCLSFFAWAQFSTSCCVYFSCPLWTLLTFKTRVVIPGFLFWHEVDIALCFFTIPSGRMSVVVAAGGMNVEVGVSNVTTASTGMKSIVVRITGSKGWFELGLIQKILKLEQWYHRSDSGTATVTGIALMSKRWLDWLAASPNITIVDVSSRFKSSWMFIMMTLMMIRMRLLLTKNALRGGIRNRGVHDWLLWMTRLFLWAVITGYVTFANSSERWESSGEDNKEVKMTSKDTIKKKELKASRLNWPSSQLTTPCTFTSLSLFLF